MYFCTNDADYKINSVKNGNEFYVYEEIFDNGEWRNKGVSIVRNGRLSSKGAIKAVYRNPVYDSLEKAREHKLPRKMMCC